MQRLTYKNNVYNTPADAASFFGKLFPSFSFYTSFLANIYFSAQNARKGNYDDDAWQASSYKVLRALERTGLKISVSGIEHLQGLNSPCVIVGNHVSMMDTVLLPIFVIQELPMTFIIKESLMNYPVFKHVMRSRNPIALTRVNARQDLKTVLLEGTKRLEQGISVVVFPQTTRGTDFNPRQFNTIGIKLAHRAGVPVLPLALKTDAWSNGKLIKDLGRIRPEITAHFAFDAPLTVEGKGREQHQKVINFISGKLKEWQ
ncbi:MAG TPA: 1-acyl-sn-glycerol-3-phosphate acyltransferase [Desulfobacterales bacterium]|nr:1-acyl-sn-glycerol-3-phosphate acyltransferase [Desulfobacterales bacterium]HIP38314.1 1-acyl-sn-glycerol-3-phosphate acyltransferase [Desulfocapsa sulfexigens]